MDELTKKKISRTMLRKHCKKLEAQLDDMLANFPTGGVNKLMALRRNYETQVNKVAAANDEVANLLTTSELLEADMEESLMLDDVFYETLAKIDEKMLELTTPDVKSLATPTIPVSTDMPSTESTSTSGARTEVVEQTVKFPKIDPKTFDGNILNWQSWWDQYEAAVHKQPKMADVNKFWYLKRLLSPSAEECIAGLALTNENYPQAIELLKERYGNKQILINAYIQNFENIQKVKTMNQVTELRSMYDLIESTIRNLKMLNVDSDTYGCFLSPLLSKKLPNDLKMIMSRNFKNEVWELKQMMQMFKEELEAKERCTVSVEAHGNREESSLEDDVAYSTANLHLQHNLQPYQKSSKGGQRGHQRSNEFQKRNCAFCGLQDHSSMKCVNVTNVRARIAALRKAARCFVCLQKGHVSRNCGMPYQCQKCGKRHNIAICDTKPESARRSNSYQPSAQQSNHYPNHYPNGYYYGPPQNFAPPSGQNFYPSATNCNQNWYGAPTNQIQVAPPNLMSNAVAAHGLAESSATSAPPGFKSSANTCSIGSEKSALLGTARATICNPGDERFNSYIRILFDDASQRTYVTSSVKDQLQLPVLRNERVMVKGFGGHESTLKDVEVVQIKVKTHVGNPIMIEAVVVPIVCAPLPNQYPKSARRNYPHLRNLFLSDFSDDQDKNIDILIGVDFYWSFVSGTVVRGEPGTPVASETNIGFILSGPSTSPTRDGHALTTTISMNAIVDKRMDESLNKFFENESVDNVIPGNEEKNVFDKFKTDIQFNGEKYVVKLPEKEQHDFLPDNYRLCEKRLVSNEKRMEKHPMADLSEKYQRVFEEYKENGMIEKVDPDDEGVPGHVHYLPHKFVVRVDKETSKVRPVFDASSKTSGPSLNECLHTGPNLLAMIFDILLQFRFHKIVLLSDIKQAFLNVEIHPDDVDMLRFLLREGDTIATYRFCVVVFGLTPSPFLLLATIHYHCERMVAAGLIEQDFVTKFLKSLYMDDNVTGDDTVAGVFEIYKKSKWLMRTAGFQLRKWCSNSKELMRLINRAESEDTENPKIPEETRLLQQNETPLPPHKTLKLVLGVGWNVDADDIVYDFTTIINMADDMKLTKRNLLKVGASFFDPTGIISPIVIQAKIIFQLICKEKINWDVEIPQSIAIMWNKFIACLKIIKTVKVERCIFSELSQQVTSVQIHGFSDSSEKAYSAVIYVRKQTSLGVRVQLITSKTKVAPVKKLTVPRLELLSCLLLTKLLSSISTRIFERTKDMYSDVQITCWNDSSSAIGWIRGEHKRWSPWVDGRVQKIRAVVPPTNWRHVPGCLNPADVATREISPDDVGEKSVWLGGAEYLYGAPQSWPVTSVDENITLELKGSPIVISTNVTACDGSFGSVIKIEDFSSLYRLYCVVAFILRYKHNLLARIRNREKRVGELTLDEYKGAKNFVIRYEQSQIKKSDIFQLQKKSLNLFEDEDGIIRVKGRLENSTLNADAKFPIFLQDDHFAHMLIKMCHAEIWHGMTEHTLSKFRDGFWLVRGRQIVSRTIYLCVVCKRHLGKGLLPPPSPPLPVNRVSTEYCFQTAGVDFAGPLLVKQIYKSDGTMHKAYICLFTCAASRSVHLELTPNLKAETFIRAFKRFTARRGTPSMLISDNAKTFVSLLLKSFLLRKEVESSHILPASPWWGGFYERLVKSVKLPLKKVLGKAKLTYEEMETMLIEVEGVVNCRPLTYIHQDDVLEPLTPSHLLSGRNIGSRLNKSTASVDTSSGTITKRVKYLQTTMQSYWQRFQHVYLAELREHHMYASKRKTSDKNTLIVGDVVVIKDDKITPRNAWRLGRVESLVVGKDRHVRGANLVTRSPEGRRSVITRPLQKIIPFEITSESNASKTDVPQTVETEVNVPIEQDSPSPLTSSDILPAVDVNPSTKKRRACAVKGELIRRDANQK